MLRKWERKYWLSTQYAVKAVSGGVIKLMTKSIYGDAELVTSVVMDRNIIPDSVQLSEMRVIRKSSDSSKVYAVPRYAPFADFATALASQGANFQSIAGNTSEILVSYIVPAGWVNKDTSARELFRQPILTGHTETRVALLTPVTHLAELLRHRTPEMRLEHVFDF